MSSRLRDRKWLEKEKPVCWRNGGETRWTCSAADIQSQINCRLLFSGFARDQYRFFFVCSWSFYWLCTKQHWHVWTSAWIPDSRLKAGKFSWKFRLLQEILQKELGFGVRSPCDRDRGFRAFQSQSDRPTRCRRCGVPPSHSSGGGRDHPTVRKITAERSLVWCQRPSTWNTQNKTTKKDEEDRRENQSLDRNQPSGYKNATSETQNDPNVRKRATTGFPQKSPAKQTENAAKEAIIPQRRIAKQLKSAEVDEN